MAVKSPIFLILYTPGRENFIIIIIIIIIVISFYLALSRSLRLTINININPLSKNISFIYFHIGALSIFNLSLISSKSLSNSSSQYTFIKKGALRPTLTAQGRYTLPSASLSSRESRNEPKVADRAATGSPVWISSNHFRASSPSTVGGEAGQGVPTL